eukprot:982930-Amphidinium_carterae.2
MRGCAFVQELEVLADPCPHRVPSEWFHICHLPVADGGCVLDEDSVGKDRSNICCNKKASA